VLKVFSELDNSNATILVENLNFIHMVSGSITIYPSNSDLPPITISEGQCLNPDSLKEQIYSISKLEVKHISKGLVVINSDYKAFINVLLTNIK